MVFLGLASGRYPFASTFGAAGYAELFLITFLANAGVAIPIPYLPVVVLAATQLNPTLVALCAGGAAALGELSGYLLGVSARTVLPAHPLLRRTQRVLDRGGDWLVLAIAFLPNPFTKLVGAAVGAQRRPLWRYLLLSFLGKSARFWLLALGAAAFWPH
ncbi:MAG: hypothetical protein KatS3mg061_0949 [Dehalococcoidia bacterium]|nr:MAG: hypothetical protein KatS3mg061_0949 [Dehalococcoidia bacterium]